jgi:hypothetical protein
MLDIREISGYTVEAEPYKAHVEFIIYDGVGYIESHKEAVSLGIDPEDRKHLPEPLMLCSIKWDGCSNWHVFGENNYQLHFCGLKPTRDFGAMLSELYEWAAELLPENRDDILFDEF